MSAAVASGDGGAFSAAPPWPGRRATGCRRRLRHLAPLPLWKSPSTPARHRQQRSAARGISPGAGVHSSVPWPANAAAYRLRADPVAMRRGAIAVTRPCPSVRRRSSASPQNRRGGDAPPPRLDAAPQLKCAHAAGAEHAPASPATASTAGVIGVRSACAADRAADARCTGLSMSIGDQQQVGDSTRAANRGGQVVVVAQLEFVDRDGVVLVDHRQCTQPAAVPAARCAA